MTTNDNITTVTMRTLEDVVAQAQCGAVHRTWGHRLALSWLVRSGVAADWQASTFWQTIDDPVAWANSEQGGHDHRISTLMGLLDTWYLMLRQPRPSLQQRARWARVYAPDIDMGSGTSQLPCVCNRYQPGERKRIEDHFSAKGSARIQRGAGDGASEGARLGRAAAGWPNGARADDLGLSRRAARQEGPAAQAQAS